jgi:hypothetical protein
MVVMSSKKDWAIRRLLMLRFGDRAWWAQLAKNTTFARVQMLGESHEMLLKCLSPACNTFGITLYTDAAALFIHPKAEELEVTDSILELFAQASRLMINLNKTQYYPVRCENTDLQFLASAGRVVLAFPCTYQGLPLCLKKPPKSLLQPML